MTNTFRSGFVAIVGRPNVGKSTLLNRLVGSKICITSAKAQTTRHAVRGILTTDARQFIFVDTPGFQTQHKDALNRIMNRSVLQCLAAVHVVVAVVEAGRFSTADRVVLPLLAKGTPVILAINKIDRLKRKDELLPFIAAVGGEFAFAAIVPVSAARAMGLDDLLGAIALHLPQAPPMFAADEITDRSERFLAAEFVREKLFRRLREELPYGLTVDIERFAQDGALRRVYAAVIVDKASHKAIVIGKDGAQLKIVASEARCDLERLFGGKVYLEVWVKVRAGWANDLRALHSLGFE